MTQLLVTRDLKSLSIHAQTLWNEASAFLARDNTHRNELAIEAAVDHRDRCERLLDMYERRANAGDVKLELRACRDHAETCELENNRKARTDDPNENHNTYLYAAQIHRSIAKEYRNCLQALDKKDLVVTTSDAPAASSLNLLFGSTGGQMGKYTETISYSIGCESEVELGSTLSEAVKKKASSSLFGLVELPSGLGNETGSKVFRSLNSCQMTKSEKRTTSVEIDLSKPCYAYQLLTKVPLNTGQDVMLRGGIFFSDKSLT